MGEKGEVGYGVLVGGEEGEEGGEGENHENGARGAELVAHYGETEQECEHTAEHAGVDSQKDVGVV